MAKLLTEKCLIVFVVSLMYTLVMMPIISNVFLETGLPVTWVYGTAIFVSEYISIIIGSIIVRGDTSYAKCVSMEIYVM